MISTTGKPLTPKGEPSILNLIRKNFAKVKSPLGVRGHSYGDSRFISSPTSFLNLNSSNDFLEAMAR